jgi:hypothetical protein
VVVKAAVAMAVAMAVAIQAGFLEPVVVQGVRCPVLCSPIAAV